MSIISAQIVADSTNLQGDRLVSLIITFPRIILAELNTHRMLSKNSASSRAIPFEKMVEAVQSNPFIPIAWQKGHKGMQGTEYFNNSNMMKSLCKESWLRARDNAVHVATSLNNSGVTKQLCNRLLEPFMWHTVLITGNVNDEAWKNFFELRCPQYEVTYSNNNGNIEAEYFKSWKELVRFHFNYFKANRDVIEELENTSLLDRLKVNKGQAEIHMMALAEAIYDAISESTPKQLQAGEWHIPFEDKMAVTTETYDIFESWNEKKVKISTVMAARTSYTVIGQDQKPMSYERMLELHDEMANAKPGHFSPFEHCAKAISNEEYHANVKGNVPYIVQLGASSELSNSFYYDCFGWCRNFKGFIQYRHLIETKVS